MAFTRPRVRSPSGSTRVRGGVAVTQVRALYGVRPEETRARVGSSSRNGGATLDGRRRVGSSPPERGIGLTQHARPSSRRPMPGSATGSATRGRVPLRQPAQLRPRSAIRRTETTVQNDEKGATPASGPRRPPAAAGRRGDHGGREPRSGGPHRRRRAIGIHERLPSRPGMTARPGVSSRVVRRAP